MVKLRVWARVAEGEVAERVERAVLNIFPDVKLNKLSGELGVDDLKDIRRLVGVKRIGKTVVSQLVKGLEGGETRLFLHKQAALVGRIVFVESYEESPGGAIVLEIGWDVGFVSWLTGFEKSRLVELTRR